MTFKKINSIPSQLSVKSKKVLYNSFFFYNLSSLFFERANKDTKSLSFKKVFLNQLFFFENSLMRVRIICFNKSFLYLDSRTKYTLVKPKFRKLLKTLVVPGELLFLYYKPFFKALNHIELKNSIQVFQYNTPITVVNSIFTFNKKFFLKKLLVNKNKYSNKFFIKTLKNKFLSKFQKKTKFLQFIIFFRRIKSLLN